ncbi:MAG: prealbumin-like fold domain-containing protein, partial [Oscillospiraceae bacterium]|nr:prealbumin-like fold domain-containing protein [Oscillospiraceae bacterium]
KTDLSGAMRLSGAKFKLYTVSGVELGEYTTNGSGEITTGPLSFGEYYVVETAAPSGFVLDTTQHRFKITADGQLVEIRVTNARPDIPNTGDTTNYALWLGLLWAAGVVLLSCGSTALILNIVSKKKEKEDTKNEIEN